MATKPRKTKPAAKAKAPTAKKAPKTAKPATKPLAVVKPAASTKTPAQPVRLNIDIPAAEDWANQLKVFAQKNPAALLVGAMAILLAVLLMWG